MPRPSDFDPLSLAFEGRKTLTGAVLGRTAKASLFKALRHGDAPPIQPGDKKRVGHG